VDILSLQEQLIVCQSGLNNLFTSQGSDVKIGLGNLLIEVATGSAVVGVASFNGRFGIVVPQAGDYNTDQVPEGVTNLYFTQPNITLTTAFTIAAWANPTSLTVVTAPTIVGMNSTTTNRCNYRLFMTPTEFGTQYTNSGTFYSATYTSSPSDGTWYHLVGTWDGSNLKLYVNGTLQATTPVTLTPDTSSSVLQIGTFPNASGTPTGYWDGMIDDVRVYNRAITATEVSTLYSGSNSVISGLEGYWPLDEGPSVNSVLDKSGNGNNGTLEGTTLPALSKGIVGNCYFFNGSTAAINCGTSNPLAILNDLTISMWAYCTNSSQYASLIIHAPSGTGTARPYELQVNYDYTTAVNAPSPGKITFGHINTAGTGVYVQASGAPFTANKWHHIIVTRTGNNAANVTMYIDGVQQTVSVVNGVSSTIANVASNSTLQIGAYYLAPASFFTGYIDDVKIFDRAMGSAEALFMYFQKKGKYGQ
jgi:hypothetical protein